MLFLVFSFSVLVGYKELIEELLILWAERHIDNSITKTPRGHQAQIPEKDCIAGPLNSESGASSFFKEPSNYHFLLC